MWWPDRLAAEILAPVAVWVLASGLDDLFLDLHYFFLFCRSRLGADLGSSEDRFTGEICARDLTSRSPGAGRDPRIAILVPCWQEAGVIEQMLDANLEAIEYQNYEIWVGVYPNDPATIESVRNVEQRHPRVRCVVVPHDGPTTKAHCLNAIYDGLCRHEARDGKRYEIILQHDAEDVVHARSLQAAARACEQYDMVQFPVFPLAKPARWITHGTYCDEFAEFHLKELCVRWALGGFIPSAGVGTAYRREAIERLREVKQGQPFETGTLTEDYAIGLELNRLGCSQAFVHIPDRDEHFAQAAPRRLVATQAYFPFRFRAAVRQRARWVCGNALQAWDRLGWGADARQWYWLWRDRKGFVNAPVSTLANALFLYGLTRWWMVEGFAADRWGTWIEANQMLATILAVNVALLGWRMGVRAACVLQVYGWSLVWGVPVRALWGNGIHFCATTRAIALFLGAKWSGRPASWAKTSHVYPVHVDVPRSSLLSPVLKADKATHRGFTWKSPESAKPRARMPRVELRLRVPGWLAIHRRLSVTLEYRSLE